MRNTDWYGVIILPSSRQRDTYFLHLLDHRLDNHDAGRTSQPGAQRHRQNSDAGGKKGNSKGQINFVHFGYNLRIFFLCVLVQQDKTNP